ncbi:MAG TPA: 2-hydroxyacyl-CoA dehydratase [Anaerolineae bacterium]|nr:2-hydroxyacyl-CoA dehydratase [Anaerolineae bacterium]
MTTENIFSIPRRSQVARQFKQHGGLVAAVLPIHYPRALLRAFNILPMEVWGPPQVDVSYGAAHVQPYVCSIVRNALSFILTGGLDVADLIMIPHACDSLQGLGSILLDFLPPKQPAIPIYVPRNDRKEGEIFFAEELQLLYARLEEITQKSPSDEVLVESIRREEIADELLARLHKQRGSLQLTDYDFYLNIRAREYLPAEDFIELAQSILVGPFDGQQDGIPIILSGIVPEPMGLLKTISQFGGRVAADDLACCGRRLYPPGSNQDPFLRMAESILGVSPDWCRGSPIQDRLDHLQRMIDSTGAQGAIFYNVKFCEPELFDLPDLRRGLGEIGIPTTTIEIDISDPISSQAMTRIEAFFEMIQ